MTSDAVGQARRVLAGIVGLAPWRAQLGHGSFVTLEFGREVVLGPTSARGEWSLWVYGASWKLLVGNQEVADFEGMRATLAAAIKRLNRLQVLSVTVSEGLSVSINFADSVTFNFGRGPDPDLEDWKLFTPDGMVHIFGPDERCRSIASDEPDYGP